MATIITMEQQEGTKSSHEAIMKEKKDDTTSHNFEPVVVESSSPSKCFKNDEQQKSGDGNRKDDANGSLTPSNSELNNKNIDSNFTDQVQIMIPKETTQVVKPNSSIKSKFEELESTKAEMGEVMEENQRLKQYLSQIMKDYQILQKKFYEISEQDSKQIKDNNQMAITPPQNARENDSNDEEEELVSLSLGRTSSHNLKKGNIDLLLNSTCSLDNHDSNDDHKRSKIDNKRNHVNDEEAKERSLDLGLEYKTLSMTIDHPQTLVQNASPENSFDETKYSESGGGEPQPASKGLKNNNGDNEVMQQPPTKKARVSVRVRCDTPMMNDGCQWRKYGQKIAKGNPCPRAYYRCTVAPSCPVRKQVQRCADDMSILITTYEGTHNHPLPVSATAMASTTSAAAYMLMSKSSSSTLGSHPSTIITSTPIGEELQRDLKFNTLDDSKQKSIYLPNYSSTFSPIAPHPTITLDLTSTTSPSINQINRISSNFSSRYPSTNLNFNFSNNSRNPLLLSWPNGLPSFGTESYINKNHINPLNIVSSRQQAHHIDNTTFDFQHDVLQKSIPHNSSNQDSLPETIAQAAKVLTSDPSFQSILTATLSSFISGNNNNANSGHVGNNVINSIGLGDNIK